LAVTLFLSLALCAVVSFQDPGTRQIMAEEFVKSRPARSAGAGSGKRSTYRPASGRPAKSARPAPADAMQLGLTIWRLRPTRVADGGARIIVQQDSDEEEWTPERVESDTAMRMGERIRFSFESPQPGYLYVIDRELYADGSKGQPSLIFPTMRTREGVNQVAPGQLIEIPGQDDRPNFFTLRQSRPDQTGELLTVIVAPHPIEGILISAKPLPLSPTQVAQWETQWGAVTETFEMSGGAGKAWTRAEQLAGANTTRQLTQDDPGPQTIYRVAAKPGSPVLVNVGLRYGRTRGAQTRRTRK
jgi:Domain of unknown function (DUF4384)